MSRTFRATNNLTILLTRPLVPFDYVFTVLDEFSHLVVVHLLSLAVSFSEVSSRFDNIGVI